MAFIEPIVPASGPKVFLDNEKPLVKMVANEPPRQLADDWFVLLDVAPKSAGIYYVDFAMRWNQIEMEKMLKTDSCECIFFISNRGTACPSQRSTS